MQPVAKHLKASTEGTGKGYSEVHGWLGSAAEKKPERSDITRIYEFEKLIEEKHDKEVAQEYIEYINDDV